MRRLIGVFAQNDLKVINSKKPFVPFPAFNRIKNKKWNESKIIVRARGGVLWNGTIYRLSKITKLGDKILIELGEIDFKTHYATSFALSILQRRSIYERPNGIYLSSYILTSDQKFLFGYKSGKSIAQKEINFIGGSLNKDEMEINSASDLFKFFVKEFEEELGLSKKSIRKLRGLGIFVSDNLRIAIVFMCYLNLTQKEVLSNSSLNFENKRLVFFSKDELSKSINNPKINPNIQGTFSYAYNYL